MHQLSNLEKLVLASAREELNNELPLLREILAGTHIKDIVLAPFEEIMLSDKVSLQKLQYMWELSRQLRQLPPDNLSEKVEDLLLYMNFNDKLYISYQLTNLSEIIHSLPTTYQQLSRTKLLLKVNKQKQEHTGFQYCPNCPSLKDQISEWLQHEGDYLEHQLQYAEYPLTKGEVDRWRHLKLKTNLTVSELAFFLRVIIDYGLLKHPNKTEVSEFFARFFSSTKQERISAESLRKKMYEYDNSSSSAVQELFLGLFQLSKKIRNN